MPPGCSMSWLPTGAVYPLITGLLACVLTSSASAQTIAVVPSLRAGDQFRLRVVHARENSARPQQNATMTTLVDVRVLAVAPEGTTIEWQPGAVSVDNPAASNDPLLRAANDALANLVLRISLSADGRVSGLVNEKDVVARLQSAADVIVRGLMAQVPPDQRAAAQSVISNVLSPPVLVASAMRDVEAYFALGTVNLEVGKASELSVQRPNPFGGDSLPAVLWVNGDSVTPDAFVILIRTIYDKDALAKLTKLLLSQPGAPPIPAEELAKMPSIQMVDDARFVIDRRLGLAREVEANRGVTIGPQSRLDRWTFRLVEPPAR
jgi:hypothetical protein